MAINVATYETYMTTYDTIWQRMYLSDIIGHHNMQIKYEYGKVYLYMTPYDTIWRHENMYGIERHFLTKKTIQMD